MARALYLNYPGQAAAYTSPGEYLLGSDVLVVPVTQPGSTVAAHVWSPPDTWQDYFRGATFTGPATATIDTPTSRIPVFVKAGGIIPLQPAAGHAQTAGTAPITLQVHAGANGSFSIYNDAGTGLGYQSGQSAQTPITYTENASPATSTVTIGPATGSYPGEPGSRTYTVDLIDDSRPTPSRSTARRSGPPGGATTAPPAHCGCRSARSRLDRARPSPRSAAPPCRYQNRPRQPRR